jgi:hypothetical protein
VTGSRTAAGAAGTQKQAAAKTASCGSAASGGGISGGGGVGSRSSGRGAGSGTGGGSGRSGAGGAAQSMRARAAGGASPAVKTGAAAGSSGGSSSAGGSSGSTPATPGSSADGYVYYYYDYQDAPTLLPFCDPRSHSYCVSGFCGSTHLHASARMGTVHAQAAACWPAPPCLTNHRIPHPQRLARSQDDSDRLDILKTDSDSITFDGAPYTEAAATLQVRAGTMVAVLLVNSSMLHSKKVHTSAADQPIHQVCLLQKQASCHRPFNSSAFGPTPLHSAFLCITHTPPHLHTHTCVCTSTARIDGRSQWFKKHLSRKPCVLILCPPPQEDTSNSATPNFYASSLDLTSRAGLQGQENAKLGPAVFRGTTTADLTRASLGVDASRVGRVLPDSVSVTVGSLKAQGQEGPVLQRARYNFIAGANAGLPGFATNAR